MQGQRQCSTGGKDGWLGSLSGQVVGCVFWLQGIAAMLHRAVGLDAMFISEGDGAGVVN